MDKENKKSIPVQNCILQEFRWESFTKKRDVKNLNKVVPTYFQEQPNHQEEENNRKGYVQVTIEEGENEGYNRTFNLKNVRRILQAK